MALSTASDIILAIPLGKLSRKKLSKADFDSLFKIVLPKIIMVKRAIQSTPRDIKAIAHINMLGLSTMIIKKIEKISSKNDTNIVVLRNLIMFQFAI